MLTPYRVLDLSDEKGFLCGLMLAGLGADVIKVERPGGDSARNIGPFYHDICDPEKSLYWFAFNRDKRSITLDIRTADGREIFKKLIKTADFLIECFPPGYMDSIGLSYKNISQLNPRIIVTSITMFGQDGPHKNFKGSDLIGQAMGGLVYITGDTDRPPVRFAPGQAYTQAGAQAAAGTLIAHYYRQRSGKGQQVDVSVQECVSLTQLGATPMWDMRKVNWPRKGVAIFRDRMSRREIWPCKDGYIMWQIDVAQRARRTYAIVEWMDSEGKAGDLKDIKWEKKDMHKITEQEMDAWSAAFGRFFLTHTKLELYQEATKRGAWIFPVSTARDLLEDSQLEARGFWVKIEHPELQDSLIYPGAPVKLAEKAWKMGCRAPLIGEHNESIYTKELGFSKEELTTLKQGRII
jgi:crotonobetainyl-CoA:carnitine CoA-transferase CaiB-like acyl-CoA transferase